MLNFEPGKDDPSPGIIFEIIIDFTKKNQNFNLKQVFFLSLSNFLEVICYLSESLRNMEKEVPEERTFDSRYQHLDEEMDISDDLDDVTYDETNLSLEQLQELFLATQGIPEVTVSQNLQKKCNLGNALFVSKAEINVF